MTAAVASLWRHPVKAIGRESLEEAELSPGAAIPGDRRWAVLREGGKAVDGAWSPCMNFLRAASSPRLMAVTSRLDGERLHLSHPDRPDLDIDPDTEGPRLVEWVRPLVAEGRAGPVAVVRAPEGAGLADAGPATVSLASRESHAAVEERLGRAVSPHRWRANVWIEGVPAWEEFGWIGRTLRIGTAEAVVKARIGRCESTSANPETGERDADLLSVLDTFGARDFSVELQVTAPGRVRPGDIVVPA